MNSGNQVYLFVQHISDVIAHLLCFLKACFYFRVWKDKIKNQSPWNKSTNSLNEGDSPFRQCLAQSQLCHAAALQLSRAQHSIVCTPLPFPQGQCWHYADTFHANLPLPLWSHVALQRKASPSGPRNLKGEAGTGVAPRESLWERMDALREREKGKRKKKKDNEKCTICNMVVLLRRGSIPEFYRPQFST